MKIRRTSKLRIRSLKKGKRLPPISARHRSLLLRGLVLLLLATGFGFGARELYNVLCGCNFFQITSVIIEGNRMTDKEEITNLSRIDIHSNLLAIDTGQVRALLENHPWIAAAEVVRDWPNRLLIQVKEKKPAALLNREAEQLYLDSRGRIIAATAPAHELDFPVITGLENAALDGATTESRPQCLNDVFEFLRLANRNNPILPEQNISEIHVGPSDELTLYLLDRPFPIYLGSEGKIATRYYRLVKVLKDLYRTREFSEVSYIRLDYQKDAILVGKMKTGATDRG